MARVRCGVLGTGSIARTVVAANPGTFVAAGSRDADAIAQATAYEAVMRAATAGRPVTGSGQAAAVRKVASVESR